VGSRGTADALTEAHGTTLRIHAARTGAGFIEVHFDDDGPGLRHPERVFDPFYTTKPVGRGTGLGLTLVHRFQEEFGGSVIVRNRAEGGASITLRHRAATPPADVPAAAENAGPRAGRAAIPETASYGGNVPRPRVLIVEDERPLLDLQARMLERLGYESVLADNGVAAREVIRAQHVDAVISDVKMPGEMNGAQLYAWIQTHRPDLCDRFLFVTGDVHDPALREMLRTEPDRFVTKPFVMQDYLDRVRTLMSNREVVSAA
jgi:CheY-like chemotaxis protein